MQSFLNENTSWDILHDEIIYGKIHNFKYSTLFSDSIDALINAGCDTQQIYSFFQNIGINVYENDIKLYLKHGIKIPCDTKYCHSCEFPINDNLCTCNKEIKIGDKYYNPKAPHLGVRIANEQTLKNIAFAKTFNHGTCYLIKVK